MKTEYNVDYASNNFTVTYNAESISDSIKLNLEEIKIKKQKNPHIRIVGSRQRIPIDDENYLMLSISKELADKIINPPQFHAPNAPSHQ